MFLTVEKFLEKYHRDRMPYFKVYKGTSIAEKHCMERLTELPEGVAKENTDELLAQGADKLQSFFDSFDDGNVTVVCKSAPKNDSGNQSNVRWGDGKNSSDMTKQAVGNATGGGYVSPTRQMKEMLEMLVMLKGIMGTGENDRNSQAELMRLQLEMADKQRKADLKALKDTFERQKMVEEYEAMLAGEPPSVTDTLLTEAIGLIKPLATTWMMKQSGATLPPAQLPVVNGMEAVKPKKAKVSGNPQPMAQQAPNSFHPMHNASMDLIMHYVREIAIDVFPEFSVNEVMPALAFVSKMGKDAIRNNVIPIIEAQRQQKAASASFDKRRASAKEEEE
jgi:hypothetical protein